MRTVKTFIDVPTLLMRAVGVCGCAGSNEPSLPAYEISTKITGAASIFVGIIILYYSILHKTSAAPMDSIL